MVNETTNEFMQPYTPDVQQDPNALYADMIQEDRVKNIISQINPDLLCEDIEHRIRGEIKDRYTKEWKLISKQKKPVSELLISNYISFLGSILNQNTALSNFTSGEINNLMALIIEYLRDDLSDNDEEYGFAKVTHWKVNKTMKKLVSRELNDGMIVFDTQDIEMEMDVEVSKVTDNNEMTRIANIICMSTFAVFKRAQNGMEARRIFSALKVTESNMSGQQQKKGVLDFLKFGS